MQRQARTAKPSRHEAPIRPAAAGAAPAGGIGTSQRMVAQRRQIACMFGATATTDGGPIMQRRAVAGLGALKAGIATSLNAGEVLAGSNANLLSATPGNVDKLAHLYTPMDMGDPATQDRMLRLAQGKAWRESWYDRVDQRVQQGAQQTTGDALFWAEDMRDALNAEAVDVYAVELLGDELHDRGLGPAKVSFAVEHCHNPLVVFSRTYVIKPEDRSVEQAVLGSGDSVATRLNRAAGLSAGRRVNTLDMFTDPEHGTMIEFVTTSVRTAGEWALRKAGFWDSTDAVTTETIAMALLTGLYDLHDKNVMSKGGAPVLIDADVAARPREFEQGPSDQAGFAQGPAAAVRGQIGGDRQGASAILQYAIDHPEAVTSIVVELIGQRRSRIVPAHTDVLAAGLRMYVVHMQEDEPAQAAAALVDTVKTIHSGQAGGSPGLIGELGPDEGDLWDGQQVGRRLRDDFDRGVIPHFQYEAATGRVFQHGVAIWRGRTLAEALAVLHDRLRAAK